MSSFPVVLERACRDRAVTDQQMGMIRQAWTGVDGLMVINPTILPTSNNVKTLPFSMLREAFGSMTWAQPVCQRRAMVYTSDYLTPQFAEDLGECMGVPAGKDAYPEEFMEDAIKQLPIYFETEDPSLQGICCVCYKKGVLGRCPNPHCGLLMHYTCVHSESPGAPQTCRCVGWEAV